MLPLSLTHAFPRLGSTHHPRHAPVEPPTSHAELALTTSPTAVEPPPSVNTKVAIFIGKVPDPPATPLRVLNQSFLI